MAWLDESVLTSVAGRRERYYMHIKVLAVSNIMEVYRKIYQVLSFLDDVASPVAKIQSYRRAKGSRARASRRFDCR